MRLAVWREGDELPPSAFLVSSDLSGLPDMKTVLCETVTAAGNRAHGSPSRSRWRIASRFWCSVSVGLRLSLALAPVRARPRGSYMITTYLEL